MIDFVRRILICLMLCRVFFHPLRSFCCLSDDITPFADLLKINKGDSRFRSECDVSRKFIFGETEGKIISSVPELCELLLPVKRAFPSVYKLYAGELTFGARRPNAICDASFSVLTKLITKKRQSMSHGREGDQRRRAIEALEARASLLPRQYCDCG